MAAFLAISVLFIGMWGAMIASKVYRFMFLTCTFFATTSVLAFLLLLATVGLGLFCWSHFGLGLTEYRKCLLAAVDYQLSYPSSSLQSNTKTLLILRTSYDGPSPILRPSNRRKAAVEQLPHPPILAETVLRGLFDGSCLPIEQSNTQRRFSSALRSTTFHCPCPTPTHPSHPPLKKVPSQLPLCEPILVLEG